MSTEKTKAVPPYTLGDRVRVDDVEGARRKLVQNGFIAEMIHADIDGRPVASKYAPGVKSYEIHRHDDGRVMVLVFEFTKSKKRIFDVSLAEVTLAEGF